jgi:asparagine synthetase B (glutamine-hydrolysing)
VADSSLVVALMQAESSRPVKTFTIKFDEPKMTRARTRGRWPIT